ncbi:ribosome-associated translation inhibitor RaiA [Nitrospirales bacterium NOB]|nr:MAG: ribosomal protein S30Ae-family protein, putative sigma-54 modulation protein [Nitrospira sp. OLB3]MBV6469640.1 hypothetical protein [Nitrospirota bacterium]MCE7965518.1 ribosome-associated translation inhibitor RaiA [Nitrospira sp. NTP2]MDL1888251.1 ribosome-associated translation inhibitor RaiA [Nitrospirales bacterium NOB]QOJ34279.1 MAG: ribosome-associated translation inhibitor RaiA [Nitrospira sp.]
MRLMITGRHVAITPALRQYVESRMERLERYGVKLGTLQILLHVEKLHHVAEAVGVVQGRRLQAKSATQEMYASIDQVMDKLGAQLRKMKERRANHKFGNRLRASVVASSIPLVEQKDVRVVRPALEILTFAEALESLASTSTGVLMFENAASGDIQVLQRLPDGTVSLIDPSRERPRASHGRT